MELDAANRVPEGGYRLLYPGGFGLEWVFFIPTFANTENSLPKCTPGAGFTNQAL